MVLLLISLNFQRIITCSKKKSLWIHKLLSARFSPSLLLIPERVDLAQLSREFAVFDCKNAHRSNIFGIFVITTKIVSVLIE